MFGKWMEGRRLQQGSEMLAKSVCKTRKQVGRMQLVCSVDGLSSRRYEIHTFKKLAFIIVPSHSAVRTVS